MEYRPGEVPPGMRSNEARVLSTVRSTRGSSTRIEALRAALPAQALAHRPEDVVQERQGAQLELERQRDLQR